MGMDFNLKQWRDDDESDEKSAKLPKLLQLNSLPSSPALPLFPTSTKFPRMQGIRYFNLGQWQELELQALIFRYMIAGAPVPPQLLIHLFHKTTLFTNYYPAYNLVQSGYWGRGAMDPEPGRCRRTDGKKWRCSRDVVAAGQKYCERHVHRGRNRSRKPVETPTSTFTSTTATYGGNVRGEALRTNLSVTTQGLVAAGGGGGGTYSFTLSGPSPSVDLLELNRRHSDSVIETKHPFEAQNDCQPEENRTLRHFFDDWPRSIHSADNTTTNLSISMPGNPSSDFSLKLGTGNVDESSRDQVAGGERDPPQLNWGGSWSPNMVGPMGGPLAEALRSSITHHHQRAYYIGYRKDLPNSEATSYVSS